MLIMENNLEKLIENNVKLILFIRQLIKHQFLKDKLLISKNLNYQN